MSGSSKTSKAVLVQSNKVTKSHAEFSLVERRVIYCVIKRLQELNKAGYSYQNAHGEYNDALIQIGLDSLSACGERLDEVKKAVMRLKDRSVELFSDGVWTYVSLFNYVQYVESTQTFKLEISKMILPEYLDLVNNFTLYEFSIAINLKSTFSQRFYELCCQYRTMSAFTLTIDDIRHMFGLGNKYTRNSDVNKHVILKAQNEIFELFKNKRCDIYFTSYPSKKKGKVVTEYLFEVHTKMSDALDAYNSVESCIVYIRKMLELYSGNDKKYVNKVLRTIQRDDKLAKDVAQKITTKIKEYSKTNKKEVVGAIIRVCLLQDFNIG